MHRMIKMKTIFQFTAAVALMGGLGFPTTSIQAQPPRTQHADLDFAASGFVLPAGVNAFNSNGFNSGSVQQAAMTQAAMTQPAGGQMMMPTGPMPSGPTQYAPGGYAQPMPTHNAPIQNQAGNVQQVGFFSSHPSHCDSGGCDSGCCDSGCCGSMGGVQEPSPGYAGPFGGVPYGMGMMHGGYPQESCQSCDPILTGGILGKMRGECGAGGCGAGQEGLSGLRHMCVFCRGGGCSACQGLNPGALIGALSALKPYSEAGLCAQRWYDLSAEAIFLGHNASGIGGPVTSQGVGGPIVLNTGDTGQGDLEAGVRLSAAIILGPGGNLETTYIGGQEWGGTASASDPGGQLFSFISDFGAVPVGGSPAGFDDIDRSTLQTLTTSSRFHSGELNYRRRTVGPYCRFQGSWLVGLRYLRFDNGQAYQTVGGPTTGGGFFNSNSSTKNDFFGAQVGGDLWWNIIPGVSLGVGMKGAWGQNDHSTTGFIQSNSSGIVGATTAGGLPINSSDDETTVMGEFELKSMYRLSHSWTFRSAYYLIALDDVAEANLDLGAVRSIVDPSITAVPAITGSTLNSLVLQGFSFGAEYTW